MKLYPNLIYSVSEALFGCFGQQKPAEQSIDALLKQNPQWGSRDRRWVQDRFYQTVRLLLRFSHIFSVNWEQIPQQSRVFFSDLIALAELEAGQSNLEEIQAAFPHLDMAALSEKYQSFCQNPSDLSVYHSVPAETYALFSQQLGEKLWLDNLAALNQPAPVCIRANSDLCTGKNLQIALQKRGIETELLSDNSLLIKGKQQLTQTEEYKKGFFEIQDHNSQQIVPFLDLQPHQTVIDACAGAGGKTLQIANLLQKSGRIIAMDVEANKLAELSKRSQRAQAKNVQTVHIDANFSPKKYENTAQRLLIDAPCTGTGTWRRQTDAKYKLNGQLLADICQKQADILQNYSHFCQAKGLMVYATCSILPQENEQQVQNFLQTEKGQHFELVEQHTFYPAADTYDGFYLAVLKRLR